MIELDEREKVTVESNKNLASIMVGMAKEILADKEVAERTRKECVGLYSDLYKIEIELQRLKGELTVKDAEIARLKEENSGAMSVLYPWVATSPADTLVTNAEEVIKLLQATEDSRSKQHRELNATIKEREAEANSYRELYNELREAVISYNTFYLKDNEITNPSDMQLIEGLKGGDLKDETIAMLKKYNHQSELKYDRLIALLKREAKAGVSNAAEILQDHRDNEAKLKERRGK
jgi:hypothetical protein